MSRLLAAASAPNTHTSYLAGGRAFATFMGYRSHAQSPASSADVRRFVAYLSLRGLAPATVASYVSGVAYFHKIRSWPDPTKDFVVSKLLAGCRRSGHSCDGRWPLTVPVLTHIVQILPDVCLSQFEAQLFRAVMLCAFFGFMRIGEFAAISRYRTQRSLLLDTDVHFQALGQPDASVLLTFRHTKTNQVGPPQVVRLVQCEDMRVCPVRALIAFAQVRPNLPGSFFCHFDGQALTQYQFNATFRKALSFVGLERSSFRAHSFRIGAASCAAARGVSLDDIKTMGRWTSEAARSYIRPFVHCQMPGV